MRNKQNFNMKISVIVTCHKGTEPYFEECLESIYAQVIQPYEVIVVVDGFNKPMIYPNTTTIIREKNIGVAYSRDQGFKLSSGNYILFVDADDVLPENYLKEMLGAARWKNGDIIYPSCLLWSKWGKEAPKDNTFFDPPKEITLNILLERNNILISSLMKREVYEKVGGFDPDLIMFEDWYFFLRAFILGFKFFPTYTFLKYRQRSLSRNRTFEGQNLRMTEKIRKMVFQEFPNLKKKYKKYNAT